MPDSQPKDRLSITQFRAVAIAAQLLARSDKIPLVQVLEKTGFVRTLGGIDAYLALRARYSDFQCRDLEDAVARSEARVIPAARGCIYLVAATQVPNTLAFAARRRASRDAREFEKAGIQEWELKRLGEEIGKLLEQQGPLSTAQLRSRLPEGTFRSLGEAGKKVGLSSTLPPALRQLEFDGHIERLMEGERLDSEKYLWRTRRSKDTEEIEKASKRSPAEVNCSLADVFFQAAGLATIRMFAAWSGLTIREATEAVENLEVSTFEVEGVEEPVFGFDWVTTITPAHFEDVIAFLPFEDNLIALRGGPQLLVSPDFQDLPVPVWGRSRTSTLGETRHSSMRTIVAENQIAGFWEYDPDAVEIVTHCFAELDTSHREAITRESQQLTMFVKESLGHARSFSLDTDAALARRADYIRRLLAC